MQCTMYVMQCEWSTAASHTAILDLWNITWDLLLHFRHRRFMLLFGSWTIPSGQKPGPCYPHFFNQIELKISLLTLAFRRTFYERHSIPNNPIKSVHETNQILLFIDTYYVQRDKFCAPSLKFHC